MGIIRKTASSPPQDRITAAVARGVEQCVRFGVTCAGDISRQCALTRPLLREAPLRLNSYGEIQAMAARRGLLQERLDAALHAGGASATLRIGLSPHAPYTVEPAGFETCLALARERGIPLATHLAESAQEREFLEHHTGGFRDLWESIQSWDDRVPRFEGGPIRFAAALGLLEYPTLLAHVNYCDDAELALLAAGRASVVWCPRTHAYFRHPPHRWRDMLARGVNVAVGTDSCASSPDLNLVDDLRLMHRLSPRTPCQTLWEMATLRGARALQWGDVGAIAAGYHADLIAFDVETDDPLREILENHSLPGRVWFGGRE
jgi:cytosine/adenosine deaminase-related metal-dependent hydrolase